MTCVGPTGLWQQEISAVHPEDLWQQGQELEAPKKKHVSMIPERHVRLDPKNLESKRDRL